VSKVTRDEEQEILRLLRDGIPAYRIVGMVGRSARVVDRVRAENGIAPLPTASARAKAAEPRPPAPDPPESDGIGLGNPWIPPRGFHLFVERPHQRRWLAVLEAAGPGELKRLRAAVTYVLGLSAFASDEGIARALIAERRTADDLARLYLAACGCAR
jgi:hypothetical protein